MARTKSGDLEAPETLGPHSRLMHGPRTTDIRTTDQGRKDK